jgi:hypothetical protein
MNKFSINLVGPEALQIDFLKPYPEDIVRQIQLVLESMGATIESSHHNTYVDEYVSWYKSDQGRFTFSDVWGDYNIYAQGDNLLIMAIAEALVGSGFERVE